MKSLHARLTALEKRRNGSPPVVLWVEADLGDEEKNTLITARLGRPPTSADTIILLNWLSGDGAKQNRDPEL